MDIDIEWIRRQLRARSEARQLTWVSKACQVSLPTLHRIIGGSTPTIETATKVTNLLRECARLERGGKK